MAYLSGVSGPKIRAAAQTEPIGLLVTPENSLHRQIPHYRWWAADNGAFGAWKRKEPFDVERFWSWCQKLPREGCLFVCAPDAPMQGWEASWAVSEPWLAKIRELGFPVALVTQDGMTVDDLHALADRWDVLFIGGSDEHKDGPEGIALIAAARAMGRHVHVGRVNSWRRISHHAYCGATTVDGNYLASSPDVLLPKLVRWMRRLDEQPFLGGIA